MHGDLTTSNVLLRNGDPKTIVFIDFGLAEVKLFLATSSIFKIQTFIKLFISALHYKQKS